MLALLPEGCSILPWLVPLGWCQSGCHSSSLMRYRRRLLSSHHVMASPRSSRGHPRWPGAIRDPRPPSALATAGGGPGVFGFLWRVALLSPSHHAWGGGRGRLLSGKGGCFSGTATL